MVTVTWFFIEIEGCKYLIWMYRPFVIILLFYLLRIEDLVATTGYIAYKENKLVKFYHSMTICHTLERNFCLLYFQTPKLN